MLRLIIRREFRHAGLSRLNIITTAIFVVLFLVAGLVVRLVIQNDDEPAEPAAQASASTIAIAESTQKLAPYLTKQGVHTTSFSGDPAAALRQEDGPDAVVTGTPDHPQVFVTDSQSNAVAAVVQAGTQYVLDGARVAPETQATLTELRNLTPTTVSNHPELDNSFSGYMAGLVIAVFVFMVILSGMMSIGTGVVEEKASRVVEILLTTVKPRTLLAGKVLGIGAASIITTLFYLLGITGGVAIAGFLPDVTAAGLNLPALILLALLWMLAGYFTVAALAGGFAATVSRQEDLNTINLPFVMFQFIPFYMAIYMIPASPDSAATSVLSYVPFFSPYFMPVRMTLGQVSWWEMLISLAITAVAAWALTVLAGTIYQRTILLMGQRVKLGQIFRRAK